MRETLGGRRNAEETRLVEGSISLSNRSVNNSGTEMIVTKSLISSLTS